MEKTVYVCISIKEKIKIKKREGFSLLNQIFVI